MHILSPESNLFIAADNTVLLENTSWKILFCKNSCDIYQYTLKRYLTHMTPVNYWKGQEKKNIPCDSTSKFNLNAINTCKSVLGIVSWNVLWYYVMQCDMISCDVMTGNSPWQWCIGIKSCKTRQSFTRTCNIRKAVCWVRINCTDDTNELHPIK